MAIYIVYPTDEQEKLLETFRQSNNIDFVKDGNQELPQHVLDGIAQG
jgi:hypothetical protein